MYVTLPAEAADREGTGSQAWYGWLLLRGCCSRQLTAGLPAVGSVMALSTRLVMACTASTFSWVRSKSSWRPRENQNNRAELGETKGRNRGSRNRSPEGPGSMFMIKSLVLTFLAGRRQVVIRRRGFAGGRVGALALRRLADALALALVLVLALVLALVLVLALALVLALVLARRPLPLRVGAVHAAPHAAAQLQPPHVADHGGGVERLLEGGRKWEEGLMNYRCPMS
ncbi:hypothetical protein EYF80_054405 [Liparis tanakae]|uniref:Uncharacterized protein n=1 Tax=Liparis tanakae TaxID=230148 RepID=A0A4Z2F303_9TELE|nr:hypothetical protein EYF80_054405 [Liparis tanakae]